MKSLSRTTFLACRGCTGAALLACALQANMASAATFSFAGYSWEQDNTPDVLGLIGNGANLGGAQFSLGLPTTITRSVGFLATGGNANSGFTGVPGYDPTLSLGMQANLQHGLLQSDGTASTFSSAVNLPNGNDGTAARHGLSLSWSGGRSLINGSGNEFVLYESGSDSTSSEGQMIRAHLAGVGYTPWYYRAVDAFNIYTDTPTATVAGAFATAFDLSALGVGDGALVDEIQVANMQPTDRINTVGSFAASGTVVFSDPSGTLSRPSVGALPGMDPNSTFAATAFDPDPLYVGVSGTVVPEPATASLLALGALLVLRRRHRG